MTQTTTETISDPFEMRWEIAGKLMPGKDPFQWPQDRVSIVTSDRTQTVWLILYDVPVDTARHIVRVHNEVLNV